MACPHRKPALAFLQVEIVQPNEKLKTNSPRRTKSELTDITDFSVKVIEGQSGDQLG
jgi:hypothetical protein